MSVRNAPSRRVRKQSKFTPQYDGPIAGWAVNFIKKNFWRVGVQYEFEDLLQISYIIFLECAGRYPVKNARHFMALFKRCLSNRLHDIAEARTREHVAMVRDLPETTSYDEIVARHAGDMNNGGFLGVFVSEAPPDVRRVLTLLLDGNSKLADDCGACRGMSGETAWQHLFRLLESTTDRKHMAQYREMRKHKFIRDFRIHFGV